MHPYIGITGFRETNEVRRMTEIFEANRPPDSARKLHVGVMTSHKVLFGIPTRWEKVFPKKGDIAGFFLSDKTYNCLHIADYARRTDIWMTLIRAIHAGGKRLHSLQLDMIWPGPDDIRKGIEAVQGENLEIILQIGQGAFEEKGNDPAAVVRKLEEYKGAIHRVLLDRSMGRGIEMDAAFLLPFIRAIKSRFPQMGIVIAGGLGPDTLRLTKPVIKEFPEISIDAQGQLCECGNLPDRLDSVKCSWYITKALELLR